MDIRDGLRAGRPLLFDGGMGTYYAEKFPGECCEMGNLTRPEAVSAIHRAYLAAGCRAIKTNTFSVSGDLAEGREELAEGIIRAGCRLACKIKRELGIEPLPHMTCRDRNLNARNFERQLEIAREKEAAGAYGFLTQPVLSAKALENLRLARQTLRGRILGGIFLVVSHENACFLKNEIAGMDVCDEIIAL